MNELIPNKPGGEILLYQTEDGRSRIEVRMQAETVWLSLNQMGDLFQRDKSLISRHIKTIFNERELQPEAVVAKFATTAADGKTYQVDYYNLDVIISVGYRVKSHRGTQFRMWATQRLREFLIKGFALDDERLKQAKWTSSSGSAAGNFLAMRAVSVTKRRSPKDFKDFAARTKSCELCTEIVQSACAAETAGHYIPHRLCMTHADAINPGLLAFIKG